MRRVLFVVILFVFCRTSAAVEPILRAPAKSSGEVVDIMKKVFDWQENEGYGYDDTHWGTATFFTGVMAAYNTTRDPCYLNSALNLAQRTNWQLGPRWYNADDRCIGQTYMELYFLENDPNRYYYVKDEVDYLITYNLVYNNGIWRDKVDGLFMEPPVWGRLAAATGDNTYLDEMNFLWWDAVNWLYDTNEHLFYRDETFFDACEPNGEKVFWSRGNGWAIAGLVRVLQYIPHDHPDRNQYITLLMEVAERLASIQPADGFWRTSLLDPNSWPSPESSGTAFHTYGMAWGVNNGILDKDQYLPVIEKAWEALKSAVFPDGMLGYVQGFGHRPVDVVYPWNTECYGVGAFLLAASEIYKLRNSIDDFESYISTADLLNKWDHGADNSTSSIISLDSDPNFTYGTGRSSMKFIYQNDVSPYYSQADRTYSTAQDWTAEGVKVLALWFKGDVSNTADHLYVEIEDSDANTATQILSDANIVQSDSWTAVYLDVDEFTASDLTKIERVSLGIGANPPVPGGSGTVYFDNIESLGPQCFDDHKTPANLNGDCVFDHLDLQIIAGDWLDCEYTLDVYPPATALGHWSFDGDANDSSGNGNDGVFMGDANIVTDPERGQVLSLDGDGDYVLVPDSNSLDIGTSDFTLWAWVKADTGYNYRSMIWKGNDAPAISWFELRFGKDGEIKFFLDDGPVIKYGESDNDSFDDNQWHHIAVVFDRDGGAQIYVDGIADGPLTDISDANDDLSNLDPLTIGARNKGGVLDQYFNGLIDDVRIFDYVLSVEEIAYEATGGTGYFQLNSIADIYDDEQINFKDFAILADYWLQGDTWPPRE